MTRGASALTPGLQLSVSFNSSDGAKPGLRPWSSRDPTPQRAASQPTCLGSMEREIWEECPINRGQEQRTWEKRLAYHSVPSPRRAPGTPRTAWFAALEGFAQSPLCAQLCAQRQGPWGQRPRLCKGSALKLGDLGSSPPSFSEHLSFPHCPGNKAPSLPWHSGPPTPVNTPTGHGATACWAPCRGYLLRPLHHGAPRGSCTVPFSMPSTGLGNL